MSCILQCLFSHVEAVVGISDVIQVHFFVCPYNGILAVWESYASRSSRIWTSRSSTLAVCQLIRYVVGVPVPCPDPQLLTALRSQRWVVQVLLFVPLRRFRFDNTVGLVFAFRLICLCAAVDRMCGFWMLSFI